MKRIDWKILVGVIVSAVAYGTPPAGVGPMMPPGAPTGQVVHIPNGGAPVGPPQGVPPGPAGPGVRVAPGNVPGPQTSIPSNLPSTPPPPPNVVNQGFNIFSTNNNNNKLKNAPSNGPNGGLPSLQSLIGGTPNVINPVGPGVVLYGIVCSQGECQALTNYGMLRRGQCLTNHMCVKKIGDNYITLENKIKIGKKEHVNTETVGMFESSK